MTEGLLHAQPKLKFAPGTRFSYSNLNYLALGLLIERASGYSRSWSLMGIAARAILKSSFFGPTINGYVELNPFQVDGAPYGGIFGTAPDMLRPGCAMLGGGVSDGNSILPASFVQLALKNTQTTAGEKMPVGLGWHLAELNGEPYAHHLGSGVGFRSELRIYPRMNRAIVVIANETGFDTTTILNGLVSC